MRTTIIAGRNDFQLHSPDMMGDLHKTHLSLENGSVWNVNADSELTVLTVSTDSTVNVVIEAETTETLDDGTVVYTNATVSAI